MKIKKLSLLIISISLFVSNAYGMKKQINKINQDLQKKPNLSIWLKQLIEQKDKASSALDLKNKKIKKAKKESKALFALAKENQKSAAIEVKEKLNGYKKLYATNMKKIIKKISEFETNNNKIKASSAKSELDLIKIRQENKALTKKKTLVEFENKKQEKQFDIKILELSKIISSQKSTIALLTNRISRRNQEKEEKKTKEFNDIKKNMQFQIDTAVIKFTNEQRKNLELYRELNEKNNKIKDLQEYKEKYMQLKDSCSKIRKCVNNIYKKNKEYEEKKKNDKITLDKTFRTLGLYKNKIINQKKIIEDLKNRLKKYENAKEIEEKIEEAFISSDEEDNLDKDIQEISPLTINPNMLKKYKGLNLNKRLFKTLSKQDLYELSPRNQNIGKKKYKQENIKTYQKKIKKALASKEIKTVIAMINNSIKDTGAILDDIIKFELSEETFADIDNQMKKLDTLITKIDHPGQVFSYPTDLQPTHISKCLRAMNEILQTLKNIICVKENQKSKYVEPLKRKFKQLKIRVNLWNKSIKGLPFAKKINKKVQEFYFGMSSEEIKKHEAQTSFILKRLIARLIPQGKMKTPKVKSHSFI